MVVKEFSASNPSVFVITGSFTSREREGSGFTDYMAMFSVADYSVGVGAVGELVNFNSECLMVGEDGMYAITPGENLTIDSRSVYPRSKQISSTLKNFNLADAKCVSANGKLFVAVDRLGVKPIYYSKLKNGYIISSTIKDILDTKLVTPVMTKQEVLEMFALGPSHIEAKTCLKDISSLKPGESIQVNMAWIVNENDLDHMYLNLDGGGAAYEFSDWVLKTGVVDIRQ